VSDDVFISHKDCQSLEEELYADNGKTVPVWLFRENQCTDDGIMLKDQSVWRKYAEHDLFPLFHYKQRDPTSGGGEDIRWKDYYTVNQAFADKICDNYKPGDTVLVHDYYLMLVPDMVRRRLPNAKVAFILQTPFPSSEFVRCLHRRKELLEGILGADVVAFQAEIYSHHFANSCARILNVPTTDEQVEANGRRVRLMHLPTGIDIRKVSERAFTPSVDRKCEDLAQSFGGKKIILGHDPMHSLSGLDKKLQAYGRFLHDNPDWREKVVLVQVTSQGMLEVDGTEESDFSANVSVLVSSINAKYGSLDHTPIQLAPPSQNQDEYFALLRHSDMALITSVREGISTTALEYAICQRDRHGMLIVSEFSGTASAVDEAILINPWDTAAVARQIYNALTASCERRKSSNDALFKQVQELGVDIWAKKLLGEMDAVVN
jgi:trehalose 6-phosphate synthase/phosphatase